jgi:tetratricopeptide (TPR) repeat protein
MDIAGKYAENLDKAMECFNREYYDKSINIAEELLLKINTGIPEEDLRMILGMSYYCKGSHDKAIYQLEMVLKITPKDGVDEHVNLVAMYYLASAYLGRKDYKTALNIYVKASKYLSNYQKNKQFLELWRFLIGMGLSYLYLGQPKNALGKFKKAEKTMNYIEDEMERERCKNMTFLEIARAYTGLRDIKKGLKCLNAIAEDKLNEIDALNYYFTLFKLNVLDGNYETALNLYQKVKDYGSIYNQGEIKYLTGISYFHLNDHISAKRFFRELRDFENLPHYVKNSLPSYLSKLKS